MLIADHIRGLSGAEFKIAANLYRRLSGASRFQKILMLPA
jgi:hypothetical protein